MSQITVLNALDLNLNQARSGLNERTDVPSGVYATVVHEAKSGVVHTVVTLTDDLTITLGAAGARAGGTKILQFAKPLGMVILATKVKGSLTPTAGTATFTAGEVGLGTTVASGNVAVLGGTAAFENIAHGAESLGAALALADTAAGATTSFVITDGPRSGPVGDYGTTPTSNCVYLNVATTVGVATSNVKIKAGTVIEIWHIDIPDANP